MTDDLTLKDNIIGWTALILVFSIFMWGAYSLHISNVQQNELCSENLGIDYNWGDGSDPIIHYRSVDQSHYNCCYDETYLTDEGYYEDEICIGFEKNISEEDEK